MPFGKSFNVVLESASESENDAFLLLDSTSDGVDVEDRVIAVDAGQSEEAQTTYLTERANGDSRNYREREGESQIDLVGCLHPAILILEMTTRESQPEVLVCSRNLQKSIDVPTFPTHITLGNTTDKDNIFEWRYIHWCRIIITWRCDCIHLLQRTNP